MKKLCVNFIHKNKMYLGHNLRKLEINMGTKDSEYHIPNNKFTISMKQTPKELPPFAYPFINYFISFSYISLEEFIKDLTLLKLRGLYRINSDNETSFNEWDIYSKPRSSDFQ